MQNYSFKEILFPTAQLDAFISKRQYRHETKLNSQSASYAQLASSAEIFESKTAAENIIIQSTEFQKKIFLSYKVEKWLNHTEPITLQYLTTSCQRQFFVDITLHISLLQFCNWVSKLCNNLLVNCSLLLSYWNKFSRLTPLQKSDTECFLSL